MFKKVFTKYNEPDELILETERNLNSEVYNYLNALIKLNAEGKIISYNPVFKKQFGINELDLKNTFFELILKDTSLEIRRYFQNALLGKIQRFNTLGYPKEGEPKDINVTLIPIENRVKRELYVIIRDNTDLQKKDKEINQLNKLREILDKMDHICNFYYDAINDYHYFSKQITNILKLHPEKNFTPSLKHLLRYVHPDDQERLKNTVLNALKEKVGYQIEYRFIRTDQTVCHVQEQTGILLDKNGNLDGLVGVIQEIPDYKNSKDGLELEKQVKLLCNIPVVGFKSIDLQEGESRETSKGIENITGYTNNDFKNLRWVSIVYTEDLQQYLDNQRVLATGNILKQEYRIVHKNGDIRWIQEYTIPTLDHSGNIVRLDGLVSDITEQKLLQEKINYLANYDSLTNLPNRNQFIERLDQVINEYTNSKNKFAVIKLDIDGFKYVNDTAGNEVGDEVLKEFTNRITKQLAPSDMLARRGGDEFVILINHLESMDSLKTIIDKISESIHIPFHINEYQLYITASMGICTYPENGVTSLELLRNASVALQKAVKKGKNNYHILSHSSSIQSFKNYSIGRDIKKAIEEKEMVLYYQPRVDAHSNHIKAAEALIRWNHPEWGLISPHEFLTIAEENGLITEIDDWVLNEVCQQIKLWKYNGIQVVPISINISAIHFMKPDWPNKVAMILRKSGIQPRDIEIEITESTILNNSEVVRNSIFKLKELGIKIALDDFGTGYSSLSYLTQYPFDLIKIDKSFIRNMHESNRDLHLTKSIIYMARGLDLRVVAEGVESVRQLEILQQQQCHEIQGYLFSHPLQVDEFEVLLRKETLPPEDPKQKAKQRNRKHYRLNFPFALGADMKLLSIAGRYMALGVSKVLIEDISAGGLKFVSNIKLPIRGDVVYQFKTELLEESITLNGNIVWKEEINEDLVEYGIKFNIDEEEQAAFSTLLNSFIILLKNSTNLPPYRRVTMDKYQYFKSHS